MASVELAQLSCRAVVPIEDEEVTPNSIPKDIYYAVAPKHHHIF